MRYSASKNSVTWKTGLGIVQGHWKWRRSILVRHCKYSSILYHLTLNDTVTLKSALKVTQDHQTGTIRKLGCGFGFLFAFYSNYRSILHHFRDKSTYWSKIVIFSHPCIRRPSYGGPRRSIAIPFGMEKLEWWGYGYLIVKKLRICSAVSIEYQRVTDGQTDGRTDILSRHSPRYAYASRCKNPIFKKIFWVRFWSTPFM